MNSMKNLLKLEELAQFVGAIVLFSQLDYSWWVFPVCLLLPDLSMLGYFFNPRIGAYLYNIFHHKLVAISIGLLGFYIGSEMLLLAGLILFAHASMDLIFGYGLKDIDDFKNAHLGWIGRNDKIGR